MRRLQTSSEAQLACGAALQIDLGAAAAGAPSAKRFRIPAAEVQRLLEQHSCSREELLQGMVQPCSALARPPISQFNVGAVGMTSSGNVYVGVNLEFLRMPLNNSVHAEQFLVANARLHGERELALVAVNAAPCGHCRQFYSELACADTVRFLFPGGDSGGGGAPRSYTLAELLPMRFKPQDLLGEDHPPLLLQPQRLRLALTDAARETLVARRTDAAFAHAAEQALAEARESYAPYSGCPAGVALVAQGGDVHGGAYLESAAFNPSMQALQVAVVGAVIHHMPCYTHVVEVVVVEREAAHVRHGPAIRLLLASIAPEATVTDLYVVAS